MNKKLFLGIGLFWLIIIVGFVAYKEYTIQTGEDVLLKTRPIDPRDLFRGDYVILSYEISSLEASISEEKFKIGDKIYVSLEKEEGYGVPKGISKIPPSGLFIKGTVRQNESQLLVEYGIESYFVPEGEGKVIERSRGQVDVLVTIDSFGNSIIRNVLIDGVEVEFN